MKSKKISFLFAVLFSITVQAQNLKYTPYDELPSIDKILKPTYVEDLPNWAKMLYQYPVNFNELQKAFDLWKSQNKEVESPIVKYYELWSQRMGNYVSFDGTINLPDIDKIYENLRIAQSPESQINRAATAANPSNWTFLGPKETFLFNYNGGFSTREACPSQVNVYSIGVHINNPDVIYTGTETGFVNKSIDKGLNWALCGQNYPFGDGGGIHSIAVNPVNPDIVYVASNTDVHKSVDGGIIWTPISTGFQANVIKIDDSNNNKLIASTDKGVYITTDGGLNWINKSSMACWDIEFKPNNPNTIYALTEASDNTFRVIQSVNGGTSFSAISSFPTNIPQVAGGLIATTPKNPNIMFVGMLSKNSAGDDVPYLYKGTFANNAWTWVLKYTGSTEIYYTSQGVCNGWGYYDLVLEVSPLNQNMVFFGTTTLFKSTNGGVDFSPVGGYAGGFGIHSDIQDMKILSNGDTWVSTDGGMNYSTDAFVSQSNYSARNRGLIGSDMWGFDQGWNEDVIVGGRYHNGNTAIADFYGNKAISMGGSESATGWLLKGKVRHAAFDDMGSGWILPTTPEGGPEGRFAFAKYPNMDQYGSLRGNIITHPYYSGTLYVGTDNSIWVSKDYGENYELLYTFPDRVIYIDMSSSNPDVMYADINGGTNGFYQSIDGGKTWTKKSNPIAWQGQIAFAISPYNQNVVYACKQVGAWDNFNSDMYRTTDGGTTWVQWSGAGNSLLKNKSIKYIVVQPTTEGKDLVYAMITSIKGTKGQVFYRMDGDNDWTDYSVNYPAGLFVNSAAAFYRDGKLRVAGNAGVWETPLVQPDFTPIVRPWVDMKKHNCTADTIQLDDHSFLNHSNASWKWVITPAPKYISNPNIRNPKVVVDVATSYTVKMTVTKNGVPYSKTMNNFFEVTTCPSINDCSNPAKVPKNIWKLVSADSYQPGGGEATNAFDDDVSTMWHTSWNSTATHPHEIVLDLGDTYTISKMIQTPRIDGENGRIKDYQLYISTNKTNWGNAQTGFFDNISAPTTVSIPDKVGRYVKLVALNEHNGNIWSTIAELDFVGCRLSTSVNDIYQESTINVSPVPSNSIININLPFNDGQNSYSYTVYSTSAKQMVKSGKVNAGIEKLEINVSDYPVGFYIVVLTDENGSTYKAKFIKN